MQYAHNLFISNADYRGGGVGKIFQIMWGSIIIWMDVKKIYIYFLKILTWYTLRWRKKLLRSPACYWWTWWVKTIRHPPNGHFPIFDICEKQARYFYACSSARTINIWQDRETRQMLTWNTQMMVCYEPKVISHKCSRLWTLQTTLAPREWDQ